jgi:hypothetical protein
MISSKKDLLNELIIKQRKNVPNEVLLNYKDLNRLVENIDTSIFGDKCTLWKGFIHSYKNNFYINFYFKGSKKNLSRLLYYNFIEKINDDDEYIKNTCINGGKCCNITHYKKFKKNLTDSNNDDNDNDIDSDVNIDIENDINNVDKNTNLKISKDNLFSNKNLSKVDINDNNDFKIIF